MAASRADPAALWGSVAQNITSAIRSYDGRGQCFSFHLQGPAGFSYALDVEAKSLPIPETLSRALGPQAMLHWGQIETIAKLTSIPAHLVLRKWIAGDAAVLVHAWRAEFQRYDTDMHWIIVGRSPFEHAP